MNQKEVPHGDQTATGLKPAPDLAVERIEAENSLAFADHCARYDFASTKLQPGVVLDISSGSGFGSEILSRDPLVTRVIGVDISVPSLQKSKRDYGNRRVHFVAGNGITLPFPDQSFQNVVTLETIEHIKDDGKRRGDERFLLELSRVMHNDGVLVLSTPNREHSERHDRVNPYHVREYSVEKLDALLSDYFDSVELYHQGYSDDYYERTRGYTAAIQEEKQDLHPLKRIIIDFTRPIRRRLPNSISQRVNRLSGHVIESQLGLKYPQPTAEDIIISRTEPEDANVIIAVCKQPVQTRLFSG